MTTFSQLVDKMVAETKRPDMRAEVSTYLNQTLRELHFEPQRGNAVFYRDNYKEQRVEATLDEGFSWAIPRPQVFQAVNAARYDSVWVDGMQVWAREMRPGLAMAREPYAFYRVGGSFSFNNYGGVGATISLSWYEYVAALKYYVQGLRPASYDIESGWTYLEAYDVNDATRLAARELTSNWILLRWSTIIEEGLRAKVYKRVADEVRARTSYSLYSTLRQGLYTGETADVGGPW